MMVLAIVKGWLAPLAASAAWRFASSKLGIIAIAGGLLAITNLAGGIYWHARGYNSAIASCQTATLKRRIGELQRDVANAEDSAAFLSETLRKQSARDAERAKRIADYETKLKAVAGCVVPLDAREWMRNRARQ